MPVERTRPNLLFINTDQQRYDSLGCNGNPYAQTPHLDQLAREGVNFTRCYTSNPVCMPARASFFTGQYPSHHGVWQNGVPLSPRADLIHHHLRAARTNIF
jgi:arylsulfatase